jgi:hypothetical protein
MPRHFKIHELLSREELDGLEAFTREPGRTIDEIDEWLQAAGKPVSRGGIHTWRTDFLLNDKFRAANEAARSVFAAQAADKDAVSLSDAATSQLAQMIFEQLVTLQIDGKVETKELWAASMALKNVINSKRQVEKLQEEIADRQKLAVSEAEKVAKAGGGAENVVAKVREILGIAV